MPRPTPPSALRQLQVLFASGTAAGLTDGQLLDRFVARRAESAEAATAAEAAFAALVDRHGPMVWNVCRRTLGDAHEAEDAFQATFLLLARKAGTISVRAGDSLGRWLHGVARRVALRARAQAERRGTIPARLVTGAGASMVPDPDPAAEAERGDLRATVLEELDRLAPKYRDPIDLCYLQSLTHDEAARRLGWPVGTVRSRLSGGRRRLRLRLARRGLVPGLSTLTAALARPARAIVPEALARSTVLAAATAMPGALAISSNVVALVTGVSTSMLLTKLKIAGTFLIAAVAVVGVVAGQGQLPGGTDRAGAKPAPRPDRGDRPRVPQAIAYASVKDLPGAIELLKGKLDRDGMGRYAALLSEETVRKAVRTGIRSYEGLMKSDPARAEQSDHFQRHVKPVLLRIADQGTWPPNCWFWTFYTLTDDSVTYDCCDVRLHVDTPGQKFGMFALPIMDVYFGRFEHGTRPRR